MYVRHTASFSVCFCDASNSPILLVLLPLTSLFCMWEVFLEQAPTLFEVGERRLRRGAHCTMSGWPALPTKKLVSRVCACVWLRGMC